MTDEGGLTVQIPDWGAPIFETWWEYWFLHGGRGSAKTQTIAMGLALLGADVKLRVVCFRAVMNNVGESVRQELVDAIYRAGLENDYDIKEKYIRHKITRTQFTFRGMQRSGSLRGLAGVDVIWVDEAQDVTAGSLRALGPSIRKGGARLIFTFNPIQATDPIWKEMEKFIGDPKAIIMEKNWRDNPWFPPKLERDRQRDFERDPREYQHIWEGKFWQRSDALIMMGVCELNLEFVRPEAWETDDGRFYLGADFGFAKDPNVLSFMWIKDGYLWVEYAVFGYNTELEDIERLYDTVPGSRAWPIGADSARPDIISMLKRQGFNIYGAPKGPGSVEDGITFLRSFKGIKIHKRCIQAANEAMRYSYKVDAKTDQVLPVIVDADNHFWDACIAEGQTVKTLRGNVPIENVRVGDYALTRNGWKRIYAAAKTRINTQILELQAGGISLYATPDHLIWTENRGFVRMDALRYNDCVLISKDAIKCQQSVSNMMVGYGEDTRILRSPAQGYITEQTKLGGRIANICTAGSGKTRTGLFQRVITSIILTGTLTTILSKILNVSRQKNITGIIQKMRQFLGLDLITHANLQTNGTLPQKVLNFIKKLQHCLGKNSNQKKENVCIAGRNSCLAGEGKINSAPMHVSPPSEGRSGWMTYTKNAKIVGKNFQATNTRSGDFVLVPVGRVLDAGRSDVYDISVEDCPEFIASGVLVHNCRYALSGLVRSSGPYVLDENEGLDFEEIF